MNSAVNAPVLYKLSKEVTSISHVWQRGVSFPLEVEFEFIT